jgi:hypothetical protein
LHCRFDLVELRRAGCSSQRRKVRSLPPCGGGLGRGVATTAVRVATPSPALPHKGGESRPPMRQQHCAASIPPSCPGSTGASSTPRLLDSIAGVSGILDHPHARAMTTERAGALEANCAAPSPVVMPRESGTSSTPRLLDSIAGVSDYWVARSSRAMTVECAAIASLLAMTLTAASRFTFSNSRKIPATRRGKQ